MNNLAVDSEYQSLQVDTQSHAQIRLTQMDVEFLEVPDATHFEINVNKESTVGAQAMVEIYRDHVIVAAGEQDVDSGAANDDELDDPDYDAEGDEGYATTSSVDLIDEEEYWNEEVAQEDDNNMIPVKNHNESDWLNWEVELVETEYGNDDELRSLCNDDSDGEVKGPQLTSQDITDVPKLCVGMRFANAAQSRWEVRQNSIYSGKKMSGSRPRRAKRHNALGQMPERYRMQGSSVRCTEYLE